MYKDGKRVMAWVAEILQVEKHPNADSLDICTVGGWKCVTKLGEFKEGELAVYVSIDAWVPSDIAPFLSKGKEPREFEGIKGERLRTLKLRGKLSQGLLLPVSVCGKLGTPIVDGLDVSDLLNIRKWDMPISAKLAGEAKGVFPFFIPKTDQERVQNLTQEISSLNSSLFEVTEKLEGSSMTVFLKKTDCDLPEFGVCSRNLELKDTDGNALWELVKRDNIEAKMRDVYLESGLEFAIQGELIGPGIQGNIYKLRDTEFRVFDIFNITTGSYLTSAERVQLVEKMGLNHCPIIDNNFALCASVDELLNMAEGISQLANVQREGLVFKSCHGGTTFKAVSNRYLLRGDM